MKTLTLTLNSQTVLLDVYDCWEKFGTISVISRTGFLSGTFKKGDKIDIENYRSTSFLKSIL